VHLRISDVRPYGSVAGEDGSWYKWSFRTVMTPDLWERASTIAQPKGLSVPDWLVSVMVEAIESDTQQADRTTVESRQPV